MSANRGLPKSIHFIGKSKSGKTTVITKVIAELHRRSFRVAAIKHGHHAAEFDRRGKDSWLMAKAGAGAVSFVSTNVTYTVIKTREETPLPNLLQNFTDFDVVVIEGYKAERVAKIEVVSHRNNGEMIASVNELVAIVTDCSVDTPLPTFGFEDIPGLCDFIVKTLHLRLASSE